MRSVTEKTRMSHSDLLERAGSAESAWRSLQTEALQSLDVALNTFARRREAEQALRDALADLGAAVLARFADADERAAFAEVLAGAPLRPPVVGPPPAPAQPAQPSPVQAPPVRVTAEIISTLAAELMSGRAIARSPVVAALPPEPTLEEAAGALQEGLVALGEPPAPDAGPASLDAEVRRLCGLAQSHLGTWGQLAPRANFALSGWLTARLRHVQELAARQGLDALDVPVAAAIRRLSGHSKDTQPGFIHGLALGHAPQHGSWTADAAEWRELVLRLLNDCAPAARPAPLNPDDHVRILTERVRAGLDGPTLAAELKTLLREGMSPTDKRVVNLARPFADALDGSTLAPLRKAIRDAIEAETEAEDAADATRNALPPDWPLFSETRGRRVVIVGGDPRPERAARLRAAFEFADVEWIEGNTTRKIDGLKERMRSGSLDLVVVLRAFNSHKVSDAIFGVKSETCVAVLADGYGVTQVRLGLERFLVRAAA